MKSILVGYPESRKVRAASKYLVDKYAPDLEQVWLEHTGDVNNWANFVAGYLSTIDDEHVVFALDDYLLASPLDMARFDFLLKRMDEDKVCARLCDSSFYEDKTITGELIEVGVEPYVATTQYCIWNRDALINVLQQVRTPWEFEIEGSGFMNRICYTTIGTVTPALTYNTNSSLSKRWEGVDLKGLNEDDVKAVQELI